MHTNKHLTISTLILVVLISGFLFVSCSCKKQIIDEPLTTEILEGLLMLTSRACFFVPYGYCDYLNYENSINSAAKGVIIDGIVNNKMIELYNPVIAHIDLLPNKDSSDVIILLDKGFCCNDLLNQNDCQILSATVELSTYSKSIELLASRFLFKFKWNKSTYSFECINRGSHVYCKILSQNDNQQKKISEKMLLPIGLEK